MQNKDKLLILIVLIFAVIGIVIAGTSLLSIEPANANVNAVNAKLSSLTVNLENSKEKSFNFKTISSGNTSPGSVSIDLTPASFAEGKLKIIVSVNTHSVDLSQFNLGELVSLEAEGNVFKPVSFPKLSGHHAASEFIFDLGVKPQKFVIKIKGIPNVEERVFEWG